MTVKKKECSPPKRGYRSTKPLTDKTMVTITVGEDLDDFDEQEFIVPKEYLTTVSEFFENSFNGSFREAKEKSLKLNDVEPETFTLFLEWLYGRKLLNADGEEYDGTTDGEKLDHGRFREFIDLYIFSAQYDVPQLRRDVLEVFTKYQHEYPRMCAYGSIRKAYGCLPSSSPILRFMVDAWVFSSTGSVVIQNDMLPSRFVLDTMTRLCQDRNGEKRIKDPYERPCDYHEHDGEMEIDE